MKKTNLFHLRAAAVFALVWFLVVKYSIFLVNQPSDKDDGLNDFSTGQGQDDYPSSDCETVKEIVVE